MLHATVEQVLVSHKADSKASSFKCILANLLCSDCVVGFGRNFNFPSSHGVLLLLLLARMLWKVKEINVCCKQPKTTLLLCVLYAKVISKIKVFTGSILTQVDTRTTEPFSSVAKFSLTSPLCRTAMSSTATPNDYCSLKLICGWV